MINPIRRKLFVGGPNHGKLIETDDSRRDWIVYEPKPLEWSTETPLIVDSADRLHHYFAEHVGYNGRLIPVLLHQQLSPIQPDLGDIVIDAMITALDLEIPRD